MSPSYIGQDAYGRLDDVLQSSHFPRLGNTGFKNSKFGLFVHLPHGQRHSNLGVITAGRTDNGAFRTEQLVQPFLHNSLAVASRNTDDRYLELIPMLFRQFLQGFQRIGNNKVVDSGRLKMDSGLLRIIVNFQFSMLN